jgi:RNA polymerase sigma factor (sigma-70 family)
VALKKSGKAGLQVWTVAQLGAFYTENRQELLAHANRVLKDSAKAEEVTQDALIKFMLAAPELESADHALSYLHRTIENLCIDLFRAEGRRPNLVVLDDATAEVEATWQADGDHSAALSAAEDAAVIRQALSLLSPAERAALVMWEVEGRSTEEIAAELGIKKSAVRHTVSRARLSLRRILTEVVLDEERGLTAMDMLSKTYKKASEVAQKSARATLSLLLVITAFLGFNSLTGNEGSTPSLTGITSAPNENTPKPAVTPNPEVTPEERAALLAELATASDGIEVLTNAVTNLRATAANIGWSGLDENGAPIGFTFNHGAYTNFEEEGVALTNIGPADSVFRIIQNGADVYLSQSVAFQNGKAVLDIAPLFMAGTEVLTPEVQSLSSVETRLAGGNRLITAWVTINPAGANVALPSQINVKLVVNADGSKVISEASQLIFSTDSKKVIS